MSNENDETSIPISTEEIPPNNHNTQNLFNLEPSTSFTNINTLPNTNTFSNFAPSNEHPTNALPIFGNLMQTNSFTNVHTTPIEFGSTNERNTLEANIQAPSNALPIFGNLEPANSFTDLHSMHNQFQVSNKLNSISSNDNLSTNALPIFGSAEPVVHIPEINSTHGMFSSFNPSHTTSMEGSIEQPSNVHHVLADPGQTFASFTPSDHQPAFTPTTASSTTSALPIFGNLETTNNKTVQPSSLFSTFTTAIGTVPIVDNVEGATSALPIFGDNSEVSNVKSNSDTTLFGSSNLPFTSSQGTTSSAIPSLFGNSNAIFGGSSTTTPACQVYSGNTSEPQPIFGNNDYAKNNSRDIARDCSEYPRNDRKSTGREDDDNIAFGGIKATPSYLEITSIMEESDAYERSREREKSSRRRRRRLHNNLNDDEASSSNDSSSHVSRERSGKGHNIRRRDPTSPHKQDKRRSNRDKRRTNREQSPLTGLQVPPTRRGYAAPPRDHRSQISARKIKAERSAEEHDYPYNTRVGEEDSGNQANKERGEDSDEEEVDKYVNKRTRRYSVDLDEYKRQFQAAMLEDQANAPVKQMRPKVRRHKHWDSSESEASSEEDFRCYHGNEDDNGLDIDTEDGEEDHTSIKKKKRKLKMVSLFMRRGQEEFVLQRPERSFACFEEDDDEDDETGVYGLLFFKYQ